MNPFEDLIHALGKAMDIPLRVDPHQACLLNFTGQKVSVQIDLDTSGERILIGTQLGRLSAGSYRERIFFQAMRVNGLSKTPRGFLAYSEKNDTLVLFQFLALSDLNGESLLNFLQLFVEHARVWKESIELGEIPEIEGEPQTGPEEKRPFGLQR